MTSKASVKRAGLPSPPASTSSAQLPSTLVQQLTPESKISASFISLSPGFSIHFAVFTPLHAPQGHLDVDLARRRLFESNAGNAIRDSLLTYSQVTKDEVALWVFCVEQDKSGQDPTDPITRLQLDLNGLTRKAHDRLCYAEIYPCSAACSTQRTPCQTCLRSSPGSPLNQTSHGSNMKTESTSTTSSPHSTLSFGSSPIILPASCHLPRNPLRQPLTFFLHAVRDRIINDICENTRLPGMAARRYGSGILWGPSSLSGNWGEGWDQHWKTRPLSYYHIEVTLLASGIMIQPRFRHTHLVPFLPSPPIPSGTPINLLPFSTPAHYLNMYSGSTSALTRQFQANFIGLGAGPLLSAYTPRSGSNQDAMRVPEGDVKFVIAWISVQNKQGEEKGIIIIWPAPLCVSVMSMPSPETISKATVPNKDDSEIPNTSASTSMSTRLFAYNRKPLAYIPELPLALQPSPVPAPATVPVQSRPISPSLFTPVGRTFPSFSREQTPTTPFPPRSATTNESTHFPKSNHPLSDDLDYPPLRHAISSFPPSTEQAFRTFTVSAGALPPSGMRNVAEGVGKFVDFMAKERERERERIKREKEREASAQASASSQAQGAILKGPVVGIGAGAGVGTPQSPGVLPPSSSATSGIVSALQSGAGVTNVPPETTQLAPAITLATPNPQAQAQTQQSTVPPNHPSYPSPPEEITGKVDKTNPASTANASSQQPQSQPTSAPSASVAAPTPFDPDSFDDTMSMDKFMMDLGMGMSMDFNIGSTAATAVHHHQGENIKVDFDSFNMFTDDDFSFFDDPVPAATVTATPSASILTTGPTSTTKNVAVVSTSILEKTDEALRSLGIQSSALYGGIPSAFDTTASASLTPFEKSSPWATTKQRGGHTESSAAPDLLSGSPGGSTSSSAGPATPEIICSSDPQALDSETSPFDPIRFSKRFHSVDAKYAIGKFSSPIIEKDKDKDLSAQGTSVAALWRTCYKSLTDPRIEIVKKLIGMKRRLLVQGARVGFPCPALQETRSEWENCNAVEDDMPSPMDVDADSERESDEEEQSLDEYDSVSRPSTPLASHLPLGPTLLSTQFQHSLLLPLSVNLKPPGAPFATSLDMASPLPNPVPTPVSPAAVAGSTSEKSKALEAVVCALATEVVENALWENAWRATAAGQVPIWRQSEYDVEDGSPFLSSGWLLELMNVRSFSSLASLNSTHEDVKPEASKLQLKALGQPMFTIGKADVLVQMSPSSLRFWSKMGLTPRSGPKDVVAFVIYEENERPLAEIENWWNLVAYRYTSKGYGKHPRGKCGLSFKDGFVSLRYATIRKTLPSLVDSLGAVTSPIVIYIVTPSSILSVSSPILRQILSSINRVLSSRGDSAPPIRFHLVPECFISFKDDVTFISQVEAFVDNVYNRIPRPIDRFLSRPFFERDEKRIKYFEAPSFTLARSSLPSTSLAFQYPPPELSSIDQHTLLHVGYKLTRCKGWLIAACIDERGEGHDLGVWLLGEENDWKHIVSLVWGFTMDFAKRANVELRLAITKLGTVGEAELGSWNALVNDELSESSQAPSMHLSLLCVDDESGWSLLTERPSSLPSQKPPSSSDSHGKVTAGLSTSHNQGVAAVQAQGQLFSSIDSTYILPSLRLPLPPAVDSKLGTSNFIPEDDESSCHPHPSDRLRPLLSSALITVPASSGSTPRAQFIHLLFTTAFPGSTLTKTPEENLHDICRNYHELVVLTQARWHFQRGLRKGQGEPLPYHLAALHVVDSSLELSDTVIEQ